MKPECDFYLMNGKHCVVNSMCIVCREPAEPQLNKGDVIELKNFGGLDGKYKIALIKNGTIKLEFQHE